MLSARSHARTRSWYKRQRSRSKTSHAQRPAHCSCTHNHALIATHSQSKYKPHTMPPLHIMYHCGVYSMACTNHPPYPALSPHLFGASFGGSLGDFDRALRLGLDLGGTEGAPLGASEGAPASSFEGGLKPTRKRAAAPPLLPATAGASTADGAGSSSGPNSGTDLRCSTKRVLPPRRVRSRCVCA